MDTSSEGVNLRVRPTGSGERARCPRLEVNFEMRTCCGSTSYVRRGARCPWLGIAGVDRGPVNAT
jgi:hypothetical protein